MPELSSLQETFLSKYLSAKFPLTSSDKKARKKEAKARKSFFKKHASLTEKMALIPIATMSKEALQVRFNRADEVATTSGYVAGLDLLKSLEPDVKAELKKANSIKKATKKSKKKARKVAKKLREEPQEIEISSPVIAPSDVDTSAQRISDELSRQSGEQDRVRALFVALNAKLKQLNPTLKSPQSAAEKDFFAAVQDFRGRAMTLRHKKAVGADILTGEAGETATKAVDAELKTLHDSFDAMVKTTTNALRDSQASDSAMHTTVKEALEIQQDEIWREKYETQRLRTKVIVDTLVGWGADKSDALLQKFNAIAVRNPPDLAEAVGQLADLHHDAKKMVEAHKTDFLAARAAVDEKLKLLNKRADTLRASSAWKALTDAHKDEITNQLTMIVNILSTGQNKKSFVAAEMLIADGNNMLKDFETAGEKVKEIKSDFDRIQKVLKEKSHKKTSPARNANLQEALDKLKDSWSETSITAAVTKTKTLVGQVITDTDSYQKLAILREDWRARKKPQFKSISKELDKLDEIMSKITKKSITKFVGGTLTQFENLKTKAGSETSDMNAIDAELDLLGTKVRRWASGFMSDQDKSDMYVDNATGQEKLDQTEQTKTDLQAAFKQTRKVLKKSKKKNSVKEAKEEYEAIASLLKSAKKLIKDPKTFDQAQAVIDRCDQRIISAEKTVRSIPVSELKTMHLVWDTAVTSTEDRLKSLIEAVVEKSGVDEAGKAKLDTDMVDKLRATLTAAQKLLDPKAFNKAAALYAASEVGKVNVEQAREESLRRIHVLKEIIANDAILKAAQANPFGIGGVLQPVYLKLKDFEYKSLIGV